MPDLSLLQWVLVELGLVLVAVLAYRMRPWQQLARGAGRWMARTSERPVWCFCGLLAAYVVVRLALLPIEPVPIPLFHDEFSYLLGADTFAHGRLTNPPLPVPIAFETIHTNMAPTYQSMYLPGPALLLALGQVLGSPWIGVLLISALFPAVLYWALAGWVRRPYALLGAVLAWTFAVDLNWWFDNYFCVALSAVASSLVLGAVPRIAGRLEWRSVWLLGVGLVILVYTRPYEGFCVAFPCVLVLVWALRREGLRRIAVLAVPPAAMLAVAFGWLLYYNWRGTGHALLFPYALNFRTYHITGPFLFSTEHRLPQYRIDMLRRFYIFAEVRQYKLIHAHPWEFLASKVEVYYSTYLFGCGVLLVAGLVYAMRRWREGLLLAPLLAFAGFAVNVVLMAWTPFPQYAAPAAPVLYLLVVLGVDGARRSEWRGWNGRALVNGLALAEAMLVLSIFGYHVAGSRDLPQPQYVSGDRAAVQRELLSRGGKQLALVRYTNTHDGWQEWVFNGADPEHAPLVWARSLNPQTDAEVIAAFPGRAVWLVTPDRPKQLVQPYSPSIAFLSSEYGASPTGTESGKSKHGGSAE